MIYVDSSVLVALHVTERDSEVALGWFQRHTRQAFLCSDWTDVEVASALSRKVRSGKISIAERQKAELAYRQTKRDSFEQVAVSPEHFQLATIMVRHQETGLRSGDALHLAIADGYGSAIATLDQTFAAAAAHFGVAVEPLF